MPTVLKSGRLNLLEPSGPVQACNGIDLPLPLPFSPSKVLHKPLHNGYLISFPRVNPCCWLLTPSSADVKGWWNYSVNPPPCGLYLPLYVPKWPLILPLTQTNSVFSSYLIKGFKICYYRYLGNGEICSRLWSSVNVWTFTSTYVSQPVLQRFVNYINYKNKPFRYIVTNVCSVHAKCLFLVSDLNQKSQSVDQFQ